MKLRHGDIRGDEITRKAQTQSQSSFSSLAFLLLPHTEFAHTERRLENSPIFSSSPHTTLMTSASLPHLHGGRRQDGAQGCVALTESLGLSVP